MLLQLEQECLDVYRNKVDQASRSRAHLLQALADSKAEFARLLCSLGEQSVAGIVRNPLYLLNFVSNKLAVIFGCISWCEHYYSTTA